MSEEEDGEDNREELSRGGDGGAHERVEVADRQVDEVLPESCGQREAQDGTLRRNTTFIYKE